MQKAISLYPTRYIIDSYWNPEDALNKKELGAKIEIVAYFSPLAVNFNKPAGDILYDSSYLFLYQNMPFPKIMRTGPYFDVIKIS